MQIVTFYRSCSI